MNKSYASMSRASDHEGQSSGLSKSKKLTYVVASVSGVVGAVALVVFISLSLPAMKVNPADNTTETTIPNPVEPSEPLSSTVKFAFSEFAANIEPLVDPCDDFHEYACGRFSKRYPLVNGEFESNYFTIHQEQVHQRVIQKGLEGKLTNLLKPFSYAQRIWSSCTRDNSMTAEQMKKLTEYLKQLDTLDSWQSRFIQLTRDGYNVLLTLQPGIFTHGFSAPSFDAPELEFSAAYSPEESSPLLEYYSSLIKLYKVDAKEEEAIKLAREMMEFENWMSTNRSSLVEKTQDPPIKTMTIEELDKMTQMDWNETIIAIFNAEEKLGGREYRQSIINDVKYVKNFRKMMDSKDEAFLSEYLKFAVVRQSCFFLGQECRDLHFKMAGSVHKFESKQKYIEQMCYNTLDKYLQEVLFRMHDPVFDRTKLLNIQLFVDRIFDSLNYLVGNFTWMDRETKQRMAERSSSDVLYNNGYSLNTEVQFTQRFSKAPYFEGKTMDIYDYFTGLINFHRKKRSSVLKTTDFWPLSFLATHPLWHQAKSEFYVPSLFIKGLFMSEENIPDYLTGSIKFGFYGSLLAHEKTHQFDALTANFSEKWAWRKKVLWSKDTRRNFDGKMQCLIDAYDGQQVASGKINGTSTLNENLADLIGVSAALEAFRKSNLSTPYNITELPEPLREMNGNQLFFLAYANSHCSNDVKQAPAELELGVRSPHKFRVNVPLAHTEEFAKAFSCKAGAKMNPVKKCSFN